MKSNALLPCLLIALAAALAGCGKDESGTPSASSPDSPFSENAKALANALNHNDTATLRRLLQNGINPNIVLLDGTTVLHAAAGMGRTECVRLLLAHGADVNIVSPRGNPLHFATRYSQDNSDIVHLLLDAGVKLDAKDSNGNTPLDNARKNNLEQSVELIEKAVKKK